MKRPKGSLVTYTASAAVRGDEIFTFSDMKNINVYSKLLVANKAEILSIIDRENDELKAQLIENGECPENCFIEEAMSLLNERRDSVLSNLMSDVTLSNEYENESSSQEIETFENVEVENTNDKRQDILNSENGENLDISTDNQQSKFHYFYQGNCFFHSYPKS